MSTRYHEVLISRDNNVVFSNTVGDLTPRAFEWLACTVGVDPLATRFTDFEYLCNHHNNWFISYLGYSYLIFYFADQKTATLFKLTFGGT